MIKGSRNYYKERENLISNGYGYYNNKYYRFNMLDIYKKEELNKTNPKVIFFSTEGEENHKNYREIRELENQLLNTDEQIVELEFYSRGLKKRLNELKR